VRPRAPDRHRRCSHRGRPHRRARRSGGVPGHRDAVRHGRAQGQSVPPVHRTGPPVRARLRHDHGIDAVRDRQRLPVHQGSAHHQRFQVWRPA